MNPQRKPNRAYHKLSPIRSRHRVRPDMLRPGGPASRCHNLRRDSHGTLVPVGYPATIAPCGDWTPVCDAPMPDGTTSLLMAKGNDIGLFAEDEVHSVATLPSPALCAATDGANLTVMTTAGPCRVRLGEESGEASLRQVPACLPGLHFTAVGQLPLTARVSAVQFAAPYARWGSGLSAADIRGVTSAMAWAYNATARTAAESGRFIQPLLVRYKLRDAEGRVIFAGPPVVVCPDGGWQGCGAAVAESHRQDDGTFTATGATSFFINSFRLAIDLPGEEALADTATKMLAAEVAAAEVCVMPQVHPLSTSASSEYRMEGGEGGSGVLRMYVPGATLSQLPLTAALTARMAPLAALMEGNEVRVATVSRPFAGGMRRVEVTPPATDTLMLTPAESNTLTTRLAAKLTQTSPGSLTASRLNRPHGFTAECVCQSGTNTVWGKLTRLPFAGHDLESLSTGDGVAGLTEVSVSVTMLRSDGTEGRVVRNHTVHTGGITLSPLLTYPDPSARRMEIRAAMRDGTVMEFAAELTPGADGTYACYLSPDLSVPELTAVTGAQFTPFTPDDCRTPMPGHVASAARSTPTDITAAVECTPGQVAQITPAWGANASWDYASGRFYIFSTAGIFGFSLGTDGRSPRAAMIDPRRTPCRHGAVLTPSGVLALAGGDLISLAATRATTLLRGLAASMAGYDGTHDELWLTGNGPLTVYSLTHGAYYTRSTATVKGMLTVGASLIIKCGDVLLNAASEEIPGLTDVAWEGEVSDEVRQADMLMVDMEGADIQGTVTLSDRQGPICRATVSGTHRHPMLMRVLSPARMSHSVSIGASVSPDFRLRKIIL